VRVPLVVFSVFLAVVSARGVVDNLRTEDKQSVWIWAVLFLLDSLLASLFWVVR
jgi:hypothetical protein